ncbi:rRNA maturation RNase YbeY [Aliiroseovarius sediminis]|uniref:rRNA maturation RNase YbeY n=1 Tax=Aliiroseovarius sediminis TaxID=2925839 RepID=UPI001F563227|nr:rRNA maturation RNase YbeY [Aliiroseovarius sediminis]MCI2395320.1 rRNA maturation RNase YbeY [Aliiroseovarius sediminis]
MIVDVVFEDDRWNAAGLEVLADHAAQATLAHLGLTPPFGDGFEVSLLACDDKRIAALNADFRDKPTPTNVLSWPSEDRASDQPGGDPHTPTDPELGDIAIAFDTCTREAAAQGKQFPAHVTHLLVHGMLHLLGYDHIDDKDAALMEGLEVEILGKMGICNPYTG